MTNTKKPLPPLPFELWVRVFKENQPNPLELLSLAQLEKTTKNPEGLAAQISSTTEDRASFGGDAQKQEKLLDDRFFNSFNAAAADNSLMKRYSPELAAGTNMLDAFNQRMATKDVVTSHIIAANYSGKTQEPRFAPVRDFDLAMSYAVSGSESMAWFKDASDDIKANKKIAIEVVGKDARALEYVSAELRNDKKVVLAAARQDGRSLQFASAGLRKDKRQRSRDGCYRE